MPDFNALIDGVIARETRTKLASFLETFETVEFGRTRKLEAQEIALILRAVDHFLLHDSFMDIGMAEFRDLHERLSLLAAHEGSVSAEDAVRFRNACFDALTCIKALEARLARVLDQHPMKTQPSIRGDEAGPA